MDQKKTDTAAETVEKQVTSETVNSDIKETFVKDAEKQLEGLKTSVLDKMAEIEELHALASEQEKKFEAESSVLQSRIKELEVALDNATKEKMEAVSELSKVKEEALLNQRLRELRDLNLLRSEEEAQVKQAEKIKDMTDEEFGEYKTDLLDIRTQALGSLSADKAKTDEPAKENTTDVAEIIVDNTAKDASEESKAKIRQIIASLKKSEVQATTSTEVENLDKKEEESLKKESASAKTPSVDEFAKAFLGILNRKSE